MNRLSGKAFFERAVTVHRYDCTAVTGMPDSEPEEMPSGHESFHDDLIRYTLGARPVYDGMRRLIGQLAGLLVLAQAGGRRDVLDLPDVGAARERWRELRERLAMLSVPGGLETHNRRLEHAHALIGQLLCDFDSARRRPDWRASFETASERIRSAYEHLQMASEPQIGMSMVDFNHACCSCASLAKRGREE